MIGFTIKKGDRREPLTVTLRGSDGQAADLSGLAPAAITFRMRKAGAAVSTVDAAVTRIESPATAGRVTYEWAAGDTAEPGLYDAEWEVTFADGKPATFPSEGFFTIHVADDLAT